MMMPMRHPHAPLLLAQPPDVLALETDLEDQEADILTTARACLEAREFKRVVHLLQECKSAKARFLSIYSQFIVSSTLPPNFLSMTSTTNHARRRKKLRSEIGISLIVGYSVDAGFDTLLFTHSDNRHQPPIPVNSTLNELLELVVNASDPWLLFLYVLLEELGNF